MDELDVGQVLLRIARAAAQGRSQQLGQIAAELAVGKDERTAMLVLAAAAGVGMRSIIQTACDETGAPFGEVLGAALAGMLGPEVSDG